MTTGTTGTVVEFDESAGLGLLSDDRGQRWPFHCVSIADGSRTIEIGAQVTFQLRFCTLRREAVAISPVRG